MRWTKAAVIAAAIACLLLPFSPSFIERWYSTGLYPFVQRVLTPLSNLVPFALFDLLTIGAAAIVIVAIVRAIRRARRLRQWSPLLTASFNLLTGVAVAY